MRTLKSTRDDGSFKGYTREQRRETMNEWNKRLMERLRDDRRSVSAVPVAPSHDQT